MEKGGLFNAYKDEKQWDARWQHSTISQAHAHNVGEDFDPMFKPANDQKDPFKEKQIYMFVVFEHTVKMDKGNAIV